ncbi:hypothetical protein GCM10012287_13420 [Streptomyces daqingensis]|uniref:APOBEC-like N-terminal domain-containing protein n=1 Tax=Streptomyces daqingensis TaxID=1472640 RepID=A0ABQ2M111_9ACTN|nr:hypothetical protein [Streptomyces daqingensis]GGO45450.1 hypothetical protein GCM10012287_13420 [Streptomyces daqingensis]
MKTAPEKSAKASAKSPPETGRSATVQQTAEAAAPAAPTTSGRGLDRRSLQRLQGVAGNAAVSRLVAQRYTAPVKPPPSSAPGFHKVTSDVAAKKQKVAQHPPAEGESKSAQDAAKAPDDDKEAQGKVANSEKMDEAKPGEFDKQAFIDAVNKAIADQAPKNLDEAEKFSESGKAENVKEQVDGKVSDGKKTSAKDIESETKADPDTSAAKEKEVKPMSPDKPPANPGAPDAEGAVPDKQPPEVTDFSDGPKANDKAMADAEVTEEQLKKGNEPEFDAALGEKKKAEADSAKAPDKARGAEKEQLAAAKEGAAAEGTKAMAAMTAKRGEAGKQVEGGKSETKSKDEQKREQVTAKLQKVFDATKKDVEGILDGLDKKVDDQFTKGEQAARKAFEADQSRRMKEYKDKRYSGLTGKARWVKDKFAGLPDEANQLYQHSRKLYVNKMQGVISSIADTIGAELGKAKTRIKKGRSQLEAEVDKLPQDLKKYGQEAAKDFAGKFDDLESEVNDKSKQLVSDLATKYTEALNKVDERIKELQEANKGLIEKAKDAIVGVIKTINELKDLLLGILAKAASAIMKIIKDPVGFLKNLVKAVGAGLELFISNIADHLKKGLVAWLLGTAVKAGIELPAKFDLKGIIQLIASTLGLTWDNIRARVTRKGVPDKAMDAVESQVPVAKALAKEGPSGAADEISAQVGDLKSTILEDLKSYLIPTVIIAGITWIVSLLNPASAFVRAVKAIIDIVSFVVNQGAQIVEFVNAVLDAVIEIANGGAAGVPKMVETALAASIPLLIGLLASLLGIGGLANKVKQVIQKASKPVNRAIDKIVDKIVRAGKKLWRKLKGRGKEGKEEKGSRKRDQRVDALVTAYLKSQELEECSVEEARQVVGRALRKFKKHGLKAISINSPSGDESIVNITASPTRPVMTLWFLRALVSALSSRFRVKDLYGEAFGSKKGARKYSWITARVPTIAIGTLGRSDGYSESIRGESRATSRKFKQAVTKYFKDNPNGSKPIPEIVRDANHRGWHAEEEVISKFTDEQQRLLPAVNILSRDSPGGKPGASLMIKVTRSPCPLCATLMRNLQASVRGDWHPNFRVVTSSIGLYSGGEVDFTFRRPVPSTGPREGGVKGIQVLRAAGIEQRVLTLHDPSFDEVFDAYKAGTISSADLTGFIRMMFGRNDKYADELRRAVGQVTFTM